MRITCYFWVCLVMLLLVLERARPIVVAAACPDQLCGNVTITYPFGIGSECSYDGNFSVTCNTSTPNPKPFLTSLNLEILKVHYSESKLTVNNPIVKACNSSSNGAINVLSSVDLRGSPFSFNTSSNVLVSFGCQGMAKLQNSTEGMFSGCISTCDEVTHGCKDYLCCQSHDYFEYKDTNIFIISVNPLPVGSCRLSFLSSRDFSDSINATVAAAIYQSLLVPVNLDWEINYNNSFFSVHSSFGTLVPAIIVTSLLLSCRCVQTYWFNKTEKRRKEIKLRVKYFKGKLKESSNDKEVIEKTKLFTIKELKKITDNFNSDRVLGEGGQGIVYKGLLTNGQIIAVKRSKNFEEKEWNQFINEVTLLSQVNHKNVVKLLGCCLETKLPLLVYEFVSNGTLWKHIHNSNDKSLLTWEMRVKIAAEAAGAIDYLHSSSSTPIYHRDIKSTNILLDEKFQAKVADFGISKAIVADKTHLTTHVQGTFGYLDPEYFRSNRFSEKCDVYSFGVILVELLTGQQPIRVTELEEERSLVQYFITSMNEATLDEILDPIVLEGSTKEEIMIVANLTKQCLKSKGIQRPTMKEVYMELESLRKNYTKNVITFQNFSSMEIEDSEFGQSFEMSNDNAFSCPIMHTMVSINHENDDNEQPSFVETW